MTTASDRRRKPHRRLSAPARDVPLIFFCGDPHGAFDYINEAVKKYRPKAIVLLGDIQPSAPMNVIFKEAMALTEVWWIPGNHDSDTEEFYERLWKGPLAARNLHGRVADVAGVRIAGLGGVFRGQIWMPEGDPHYRSASSFVRRAGHGNLWHGGLPRRHRTSIFPSVYDNLLRQRADVLVTHEAAGCHKKGFEAIDRLGCALRVKWLFHGHQHEDHIYGRYKGMTVRGIGYRGIVDLAGNVIVPSQMDPRDVFALQEAGEEPSPEALDAALSFVPEPRAGVTRRAGGRRPDAVEKTAKTETTSGLQATRALAEKAPAGDEAARKEKPEKPYRTHRRRRRHR